ncbi:hypothetical protein BT69DRAFT_1246298 [Atractiella rhizophila]|nr:hypothetical protein BT69DRAFT_1246298 [Atractiella rhizophila]
MALPSHYQATQHFSDSFVISCGCIMFRFPAKPTSSPIEVCLLHDASRDQWLLPKGRKNEGEALLDAALRESYEESGYRVSPLPSTFLTRSTPVNEDPNATFESKPRLSEGCIEPFSVQIRRYQEGETKLVFWFLGQVEESGKREEDTRMAYETIDKVEWFDPVKVLETASLENDREIIKKAVEIVTSSRKGLQKN